MNLLFDIWILNPNPNREYSSEAELMFKTIYEFVYDRVVYLWAEMEIEEKESQRETPAIIVEIFKNRLSFKGYTPELTAKLKGSFNENDYLMLAKRMEEAFKLFP